ncbi:MAG: hypothetical protein E5X53_39290, partial [Mesorhizobium sp.]
IWIVASREIWFSQTEAVTLVRDTASVWENQISREATIQIKPMDGLDIEAALARASQIAGEFPGVKSTRI